MLYLRGVGSRELASLLQLLYCGEVMVEQGEVEAFLLLARDLEVRGVGEQGGAEVKEQVVMEEWGRQEDSRLVQGTVQNVGGIRDAPAIEEFKEVKHLSLNEDVSHKQDMNKSLEDQNAIGNADPFDLRCAMCGNVFASMTRLKKHKEHMHKQKALIQPKEADVETSNLKCKTCGLSQPTAEKLKVHEGQHKKYTFICSWTGCKRGFKYESSLDAHMSIVHMDGVGA